jgi:outer membrane biosynthesis protein TonB
MATPTPTPTMVTPTPTPTTVTPTPTPTPTTTPTQTLTPTPTTTPTQTPTPTQTLTPTPSPLPSLPGIYYGKFSNTTITSADTGSLTFVTTNDITNTYVTFSAGTGYGYVLIPISLPQPSDFKDSSTGCTGNDVPTNNIGTVVVLDANGFAITYNIYRTFYSFNGQLLCWLCS